jgi:carboxyl-terminal processing protease
MNDYKQRNAASDVKNEINRLKKQGIDGLIIDVRNNGGGSLRTAVDLSGLFIKNGPIVQVASADDKKEVLKDTDNDIVWDGPLVVLVNELSASASEIFAAAMQDYKRAVVIGSKQTYGKGTVQNIVDLNRWLRKNDMGDMGALKLTTQKFYRVNGGATQLEGVKSDVVIPDKYSYIDIGERDYENPLPYDKITPADYEIWQGYTDLEKAIQQSKNRIATNNYIKLLDEEAKWIKKKQDDNVVDLNIDTYKKELERRKEELKKFDTLDTFDNHLSYKSLPYEIDLMKQDTTLKEKRKRWHKNLTKDIYVDEAVKVLEDLKSTNTLKQKVAGIKE